MADNGIPPDDEDDNMNFLPADHVKKILKLKLKFI